MEALVCGFPVDVRKGCRVIIYGGGAIGKELYANIRAADYCEVVCIADKNWKDLQIDNARIIDPIEIAGIDTDYVIIATNIAINIIEMMTTLAKCKSSISIGSIVFPFFDIMPLAIDEAKKYNLPQSTSEHQEDLVVKYLFTRMGITAPSYIDVGAHDPVQRSNTALLYQTGSRGLNIEANPTLTASFAEKRPEDETLSIGIGIEAGTIPFYVCDDELLVSTFSQNHREYWASRLPQAKWHTTEIPVVTLQSVIDSRLDGKWPDFLDLDIEGIDYDVLCTTDLTDGPVIIMAEMSGDVIGVKADSMMDGKGYKLCCTIAGYNNIYVRKDYFPKLLNGIGQI